MASHKLLFYASFLSHPSSPVDNRLLASISHRAERTANARVLELQAREDNARQAKEDSSSKFLVGNKAGVKIDISRDVESGTDSSKIVEIE